MIAATIWRAGGHPGRPSLGYVGMNLSLTAAILVSVFFARPAVAQPFCRVLAIYPPDESIRLMGRLYVPPYPADAPTCFNNVAQRKREVADCRDVTDDLVEVPAVHPDLMGCRREPVPERCALSPRGLRRGGRG